MRSFESTAGPRREAERRYTRISSRREGAGFVIEQDGVCVARFPCLLSDIPSIMAASGDVTRPAVRAAMEAVNRAAGV